MNNGQFTSMTENIPRGTIDIIDDDDSLREGLADLLRNEDYLVRTWSNAEEFLSGFKRVAPMTILSDMRMKDLSGIDMHRALLEKGHTVPIVYISGASTLNQGIEAFRLGAIEFLTKPFSREAVLRAIMRGIEQDRTIMDAEERRQRLSEAMQKLSPREREVFSLLIKGYGNAEIVAAMAISLPTSKQYKSQIMNKLECRSLADLIRLAG